jgi:hypothetical protein
MISKMPEITERYFPTTDTIPDSFLNRIKDGIKRLKRKMYRFCIIKPYNKL